MSSQRRLFCPGDTTAFALGLFQSGSRRIVLEAHHRPDPALGYVHNDRPVPGARGRAPSPRQGPIIQFPYVDAHGQLPNSRFSPERQ